MREAMRAPLYAVVLAAWALLSACLSAPGPEDWLEVGFRTPEQTFRTFQTGLRAELPDLEYRCLGTEFKVRNGVTQLAYREFRRELFRSQPWLKLAATARVLRIEPRGEGRVRLEAEVSTWFHEERFTVNLVREEYYELWSDGQRAADDLASWRRLAREREGELVVTVPLPPGRTLREIDELRAGREWKIDGFASLMPPASSP